MNILSTKYLSVRYNKSSEVLSDLSLQVPAGRCTLLTGPNGSGKSTLIRTLAGLIPNFKGEIYFANAPLTNATLNRISFVFENNIFPPYLRGKQLINHFELLYMKDSKEALVLCDLFALPLNNFIYQYSQGMRRALAFVIAFLKKPDLLIADEAFSSLDTKKRISFQNYLKDKVNSQALSVLFTSHESIDHSFMDHHISIMQNDKSA